jgi:hypothetical protein
MYSKCNCCTKVIQNRYLPDKTGFLNILNSIKKSFTIKNGDVEIEKKEILFRLFNKSGMRLNPIIYIVEILAIMDEPYSIHVISYNHSLNRISHVCSPEISNISKTLNCYSNAIANIKGEVLTPLKEFINENLIC